MTGKTSKAKAEAVTGANSENGPDIIQPEKFDLRSHSISEEKRRELLRLFPEAQTEGEKVDFNRLKLALGESVDTGKERYGLTWPGKADCFKAIQTPSLGTLLPVPKESVNWDTTENLIIEGDNLEVLKLLQKSYMGKVKMIYIDPPYNTGNDFIYPDDYSESLQTYLEYTGQVDSQGKKFSTNSDTEGRFHSKWLNMMYPRLYLARNLLQDGGTLWISIDDGEAPRLRLILDELFGEENLLAEVVVVANRGGQDYLKIAKTHEYLLCYQKTDDAEIAELPGDEVLPHQDSRGPFVDRELRNRNPKFDRTNRPNLYYPIYVNPKTRDANGFCSVKLDGTTEFSIEVLPRNSENKDGCWRWSRSLVSDHLADSVDESDVVARQRRDGGWNIYEKYRKTSHKVKSLWDESSVRTEQGTRDIRDLLGKPVMDHPKPVSLVRKILQCSTSASGKDIVLDFFAGSGTTAQAVLETNADDGGDRRFITVQLPEPTREESEARKAGYLTISAICLDRVRLSLKSLDTRAKQRLDHAKLERSVEGYRFYRLGESNFKVWDSERPEDPGSLQRRLINHIHHIREGRSDQDILTELLLKSGFPPTIGISEVSVGGKKAFKVADGRLVVCLDRHLTLEAIRAIADLRPERVVCLDEGFEGNDQLKVNAAQTFKTKGVPSFQTV